MMNAKNSFISIVRPTFTQSELNHTYKINQEERADTKTAAKAWCTKQCACSRERLQSFLLGIFPFIQIMKEYKGKAWLPGDIIAGLSIGVINIPQGMGFALLTQVPPVYGLYASLWPALFYFFFGTSRHISMGTMALISIMIGNVVQQQAISAGFTEEMMSNPNITINGTTAEEFKVGIAVSVTLLMGIFQVVMYVFRLGVVATFMSMPFVSAFMTGAAINIITSQIPSLLQVKLPPRPNTFKTIMTYVDLFKNIKSVNIASMVTGIICIIILFVLKEIINDKYKHKLKVPIPAELLVVVIGTLIAHFAKFNERWGVRVVGDIPTGIPAPAAPSMTNWTSYIGDAIIIAVISYAITVSMAKLMSRKHGYRIDTNQELLASGLSFGLGAFFHAFGGCQAPPRTVVQDIAGGKTQIAGLISCFLVLLVCIALGPLFKNLPNTVLAAVIIVALIPLLKSFRDVRSFWKLNRYDVLVWVVTIFCVVIFDITIGLVAGIGVNVLVVTIQALLVKGEAMVGVGNTEIYSSYPTSNSEMHKLPGVRVFKFNGSLYFVNAESFKSQLFQHTFVPTVRPPKDAEAVKGKQNGIATQDDVTIKLDNHKDETPGANGELKEEEIHTIILDLSQVAYIDIMGLNLLKQITGDFDKVGVRIALAACNTNLLKKLAASGLINEKGDAMVDVYPTVHDAVVSKRH